jgi:hypothetical protein
MRKLFVLLLLVCFLGAIPARAEGGAAARLYALDASAFPSMTALLDVHDAAGTFVAGLTPDGVTLLEDNQPRPLQTIKELHPGVQFVLAFDPGPAFALRDANGVSRMDKVTRALNNWAKLLPATGPDDLSLVTTGGGDSSHLNAPGAFLGGLLAYHPDARSVVPSLDTLSKALDVASEAGSQPGMKRAVLFVTSPPLLANLPTLQSLTARAVQMEIRVFVWIIASPDFFATNAATALKDLAISTGGQYVLFSGSEALPVPETYLAPLRHTYQLNYFSGITTSGTHSLAVQAGVGGTPVLSAPISFDMDVQPPNPMLVSPPEQIVRQISDPNKTDLADLQPSAQSIAILVDFPDGHPRTLVRATLSVDGTPVAENTTAPFDQFSWDLRGYTISRVHNLDITVVDSLGLSKTSLSIPVTVTVIQPRRGLAAFLSRNSLVVVLAAILIAGAVLGLSLAGGRLRRRSDAAGRKSRNDPLTQPVVSESGRRGLRLPWAGISKPSPAFLVRLKDDGQPITAPPIQLPGAETTFGTDPTKASHLLDHPSVSPLHARLKQEADGAYTLTDEKSVAGTWVNYEQLSAPRRLQHGDVIHFGSLAYRFMLSKPPERPQPRRTPTKS